MKRAEKRDGYGWVKTYLKREKDSLKYAAQDHDVNINSMRYKIDNTWECDMSTICRQKYETVRHITRQCVQEKEYKRGREHIPT